jgi:hypothetical protein
MGCAVFNAFSKVSLQKQEKRKSFSAVTYIFLEFSCLMVRREISGLKKRVILYDILGHVAETGNVRKRQIF